MTTQLSLYNGALRLCKERKLASLSENREPRRLLDEAWADGVTDGSVRRCLELGDWVFGRRVSMIDFDPDITPAFGYSYAFSQPNDLVKVQGIYQDEYCQVPLLQYSDENGFWYTDLQTIYVAYTSNDASYGGNLAGWPVYFCDLVEADLADQICGNLTQGDQKALVVSKARKDALKRARSSDAQRNPTAFLPPGSWSTARHGNMVTQGRRRGGGWTF